LVDDARTAKVNQAPAGAGQPEPAEAAGPDPQQVAAFEALIAANHDEMARVAFVVTEAPAPAQEAVGSAWADAWRALIGPTPPPVERQKDWLLGLAATEARVLVESGYRPGEAAPGESGVTATQSSAAPAYRSDELDLANALAALDGYDRMIVGLRYVGGMPAESIGRELNIPERAVLARIARILKTLVGEDRLTGMPSETVAEYEAALVERTRLLTRRALTALDPGEVAKAAIEAAPEATITDQLGVLLNDLVERARELDRRVWLAVGGVVVALFLVSRLFGGGGGGVALVTPVPTDATRLCQAGELTAQVTKWEALGGDWVASVDLKNVSAGACLVDPLPEPWLVDRGRTPLLIGIDVASNVIRIGPGDVMHTRVQVHNYCGAAPPQPVTVGFRDGTLFVVADPLSGDVTSGVPSCTGGTGSITMQPWSP